MGQSVLYKGDHGFHVDMQSACSSQPNKYVCLDAQVINLDFKNSRTVPLPRYLNCHCVHTCAQYLLPFLFQKNRQEDGPLLVMEYDFQTDSERDFPSYSASSVGP